jgi:hypothetical protein
MYYRHMIIAAVAFVVTAPAMLVGPSIVPRAQAQGGNWYGFANGVCCLDREKELIDH